MDPGGERAKDGKMVQSQRVPTDWNKDCMCVSQLSQDQFSPSGILLDYGAWSHLERVSYSAGGFIDLILPPTVTTSDPDCFNWRPRPLLVPLSSFFSSINHFSMLFLYNLLVSLLLWHSSIHLQYFPFLLILSFVLFIIPLQRVCLTCFRLACLTCSPICAVWDQSISQPTINQGNRRCSSNAADPS